MPTDDRGARRRGSADHASETIGRAVLDSLLEGCQVIDPDYRYLYVNDALVAQSRRSRRELVGRSMMECYPGIDSTPMFALLRRSMTERTHEQMENEFEFPDGARIVFELRFVPVPQGVCILSLDITERRHRLAAIVDDSEDAIIGTTLDGVVTHWNRSAQRIFGYSKSEMVGRSMDVLTPPELASVDREHAARLMTGQRIPTFETRRLRSDGALVDVAITLSPVRGSDGQLVGVSEIARDIGEVKRIQAELVAAKERAEHVSRELESFSYSVAHDLRAPLRSIDGFSQALTEDFDDRLDDTGRRYLSLVRDSARRMSRLIDDLLELSRVSRAELSRGAVDLGELARASIARLEAHEPARRVEVSIADDLVFDGDARLLAVAMENLLSNAWKFTSKREGVAHIEIGVTELDGVRALFVRDDGAGFDMAHAARLFTPFSRLHTTREFDGTGIGLATVHRIVRRHGGEIRAEGRVGEGATLTFTLGAAPTQMP